MNTAKNLYNGLELKSIRLNDSIFQDIIHSSFTEVDYIYLSSNPSLNTENIKHLFLQQIDNVNINLLRNPNCPDNEISKFIALHDKVYNIAIAHNTNLQKKHINKLLNFNDKDVTISLKFTNHI